MKRTLSRLNSIILLCSNPEKTSEVYSAALALKVIVQSPDLVELTDSHATRLILRRATDIAQLTKGYSPIIGIQVPNFEATCSLLDNSNLLRDGPILRNQQLESGKTFNLAVYRGLDGEMLYVHDLENKIIEEESQSTVADDEIKRILSQINI